MTKKEPNMLFPTASVAMIEVSKPEPRILLIERKKHPDDPWSGHLAFPGGRKERCDLNLMECAIRETKEEVGIQLKHQHWVGVGHHAEAGHYAGRRIGVACFRFLLPQLTTPLRPCSREVESIVWLSVKAFKNKKNHLKANFHPVLKKRVFPYFAIGESRLWGFTYECLIREFRIGKN